MKAPAEVQFAQKLAANERTVRDRAVRKLKLWLGRRSAGQAELEEDELMRLWKGLFYCYWMSDKPLVQEELAENIASIIDCFGSEKAALLFMKCFFVTMGREWFGIDRWRMDKFMMMTRRFLRQMLKYNKKRFWDSILVAKTSEILADTLLLVDVSKTSLGLQLHVIDIFLEELAKVGGVKLPQEVLETFLEPYYQLLSTNREPRLKEHVIQRIFNHLIRQSDAGIAWEIRKELESKQDAGMEMEEEDSEEEGEDTVEAEEEMEEQDDNESASKAEDPRAGKVDVELPQLPVNYAQLSRKLFELGSTSGVSKSNRDSIYMLSKYFKDVSDGVFPLGDDLSDEEEVEAVDVKKSVQKMLAREEKYRKKNEKKKQEYRKQVKERRKLDLEEQKREDASEEEEEESADGGEDHEMNGHGSEEEEGGTKRKKNEEEDDEGHATAGKKAKMSGDSDGGAAGRESRKEREKKRKQEMKRKKRERQLAEKARLSEQEARQQKLLEQDLEVVARLGGSDQASPVQSKQKKEKKKKSSETESTEASSSTDRPVAGEPSSEAVLERKKKKKKSKNEQADKPLDVQKKPNELMSVSQQPKKKKSEVLHDSSRVMKSSPVEGDLGQTKREKKKKKKKDKSAKLAPTDSPKTAESKLTSSPQKTAVVAQTSQKKSKAVGGKLFDELDDWESPLMPGEQEIILPNKKYKGDVKLAPPAQSPAASPDPSPKKNKNNKKKKKSQEGDSSTEESFSKAAVAMPVSKPLGSLPAASSAKGSTPSKETDESAKNQPTSASVSPKGFPGFDSPKVSTPSLAKSHTAVFLKKALSKSVTPKVKNKAAKLEEIERSSSEPRLKKVNFVLTRNKSQDISEWASSIVNSPGVPHDPAKNPEKSLLKKKISLESSFTSLNPVQLNTQLNSRTNAAKLLVGKNRKRAAEFF